MNDASLEGKRIFVIEDDVMNMAVFAVTLKGSGATVIQDPWNSDTLNLVTRYLPVDIILLDLMLRYRCSGYDIFDKLKADPRLRDIPVVAISAADAGIEIPRAKTKGFSGFIGKPIDPILFCTQVASAISGENVWYAQIKGISL